MQKAKSAEANQGLKRGTQGEIRHLAAGLFGGVLCCRSARSASHPVEGQTGLQSIRSEKHHYGKAAFCGKRRMAVGGFAPFYDKDERVYSLDYIASEITEAERNSTDTETIQKCIHARVLPACYEGTALSIELQTENKIGCFTRLEDNTVICPMDTYSARCGIAKATAQGYTVTATHAANA
jgi:hypothetical protein